MTTDVPRAGSQQTIPTFVTDHLALAAYLVSRGHRVTLVPTGSGKILFSFGQTEALSTDAAAFSDGSGHVAPATYDGARIRLRREMDVVRRQAAVVKGGEVANG
jgi:hypothetical protein